MIVLRAGELEAEVHPEVGMVVASLRHRGEQVLAQRGGLDAYRERGSSFGIPLLHPWANRLVGCAYEAAGQEVRFGPDTPHVRVDGNGLPIHGLLAASPAWVVTEQDDARIVATLAFDGPDLLAAFPYPHELALAIDLTPDALGVALTLTPAADRAADGGGNAAAGGAVPLSFGFHPWLTLPGVPRERWRVELPALDWLDVDERGIPSGAHRFQPPTTFTLEDHLYDDPLTGVRPGATFAVSGGGRRIAVTFDEGYPCGQVFAPPPETATAICFEPMTAPPNALVTGDGLHTTTEPFTARFTVAVTAA